MRKLLLSLTFILLSAPAWAAWNGSGSSQSVNIAANSALDLPDADWTFSIHAKHNASTGIDGAYFWCTGTNSYLTIGNYSNGVIYIYLEDDDTGSFYAESATAPFNNTNDHRIVVTRASGTFTIYVDGTSVASGTDATIDASTFSSGCQLFVYNDGSDHFLNGVLTDLAFWPILLNSAQISSLGTFSVNCYGNSRNWMIPGVREYQEVDKGIAVTNSSTT